MTARFFLPVFLILLLVMAVSAPARAEVFLWQDAETKLAVTYPDTWRLMSGQKPDDAWTVLTPGDDTLGMCRLRIRDDRRFVVYPRRFADSVQRLNYSRNFWEDYINEFDGAALGRVGDNAGLGQGFASYAEVTFIDSTSPQTKKQGLFFASVYNDKAYIFECSAAETAFPALYHPFLSVLKSVEFQPEYSARTRGHYRPFPSDPVLRIHGKKPIDTYEY